MEGLLDRFYDTMEFCMKQKFDRYICKGISSKWILLRSDKKAEKEDFR